MSYSNEIENTMLPKVSIILPVFNAEMYLDRSIGSVLSQDYPNKELIIVDDKSSDNSLQRAIQLTTYYKNCRVVSLQKNEGAHQARTYGLKFVTGEFVLFLDADDELAKGCIPFFIHYISCYPTHDIVVGNFQRIYKDRTTHSTLKFETLKCTEFKKKLIRFEQDSSMCGKLYRKHILTNNLPVLTGRIDNHEDLLYNLAISNASIQVLTIPEIVYHYYQHSTSASACPQPSIETDKIFIESLKQTLVEPSDFPILIEGISYFYGRYILQSLDLHQIKKWEQAITIPSKIQIHKQVSIPMYYALKIFSHNGFYSNLLKFLFIKGHSVYRFWKQFLPKVKTKNLQRIPSPLPSNRIMSYHYKKTDV